MSKKEKFALYLTPEKKARLERRYQEDGSRSITGFIERAIDFYLDYLPTYALRDHRGQLSVQRGGFAPTSRGKRPKCEADQWPHLVRKTGAGIREG